MAFPPGAGTVSLPAIGHSEDNRSDPNANHGPQHVCTLDTRSAVKRQQNDMKSSASTTTTFRGNRSG